MCLWGHEAHAEGGGQVSELGERDKELAQDLALKISLMANEFGAYEAHEMIPEVAVLLAALLTRVREEERKTDLPVKYGRDHHARITLGELVAKISAAGSEEEFYDLLDAEFLYGCWSHAVREPGVDFARDLRGLIWGLVQQAKGAK